MEFCRLLRSVKFACGYSGVRVATFFEKLAHFLAFIVKVGVLGWRFAKSRIIH